MWPYFVVVAQPPVGYFPHLAKIMEEVKAQDLIAVGAVEPFNIGVLVRFSWLNIVNHHAGGLGPSNEITTQELRTIVDPQNIRQSSFLAQSFKHSD